MIWYWFITETRNPKKWLNVLEADIITIKKIHWFDGTSSKNAFFTGRVPNNRNCADDSNESSQVVYHPDKLFFRYGTNLLSDAIFDFNNGMLIVLIHVVLQEPSAIKIWVTNRSPDQGIDSLATSSYCWLYVEWLILVGTITRLDSHYVFQKPPSELVQHINVTLLYDSDCLLACVFKPNRPIIPCWWWPRRLWKGHWGTSYGASAHRYTPLLLLACPPSQKCDSSLNQTSSRKSGSSSVLFPNHRHITKSFPISAGVSLYVIWILYGYSWRSFFKILRNDARERQSSLERLWRDF